jgi:hypothetical protein
MNFHHLLHGNPFGKAAPQHHAGETDAKETPVGNQRVEPGLEPRKLAGWVGCNHVHQVWPILAVSIETKLN